MKEAAAVAWVHDAYAHCKVIGATEGAQALLDSAGAMKDEGVLVGGAWMRLSRLPVMGACGAESRR